jgi:thiamine transport system substrate-binding protein
MMKKIFTIGIILIIVVSIVGAGIYIFSQPKPDLVIYTYNSLLADPGYAFDRAFETHAGLPNGSVKVVYLDDAASVLNRAVQEKDSSVADVLIGIDNVLVGKARSADILTPYEPTGSSNIIDGLVDSLAPDFLLTPYDYGIISLYYLEDRLQGDIDNDTFELSDLLDPALAKQTIMIDPRLSSPGLGFLLHTIGIFGDEESGVDGVIDGDWEAYWNELSVNYRLSASWGDAFNLLYIEEEGRPMMVSYTTSPAYGACLFDDLGSKSILSNELNTKWGWQQIEGIGLTKGAPHEELAKEFIDWFITSEVQSQIYLNQWVYPAIKDIEIPDCYSIVIPFDDITPLNSRILPDTISTNLDSWLERWEIAVAIH